MDVKISILKDAHVVRELQCKITMRHYYLHIRMARHQITDNTKFKLGCGMTRNSDSCWYEYK